MNGYEKYLKLFPGITSLADEPSWTQGISNVVDWLAWTTSGLLGISKTKLWKLVVDWCEEDELRSLSASEKQKVIAKRLAVLAAENDRFERFEKPSGSLASPREALRRLRYFSEDYLNGEFDICWSLVSDAYLDRLYGRYFELEPGGHWCSHGNGTIFSACIGVGAMQVDNVSYNEVARVLVANELKLGGRKNDDQILKYAWLFERLLERGFVDRDTSFRFLFFTDGGKIEDWKMALDAEIEHCRVKGKEKFVTPEVVDRARKTSFASISWRELVNFNREYAASLPPEASVEIRLLEGFNSGLEGRQLVMGDDVVL